MKLTEQQKNYIRINCPTMEARAIAAKLNKTLNVVRGYINYHGLKSKAFQRLRPVIAEPVIIYEIWISGKYYAEVVGEPGVSDFKSLSDIRESHAQLLTGKTFQIFKRVKSKFPEDVESKLPFNLRSVPWGYTERVGETSLRWRSEIKLKQAK